MVAAVSEERHREDAEGVGGRGVADDGISEEVRPEGMDWRLWVMVGCWLLVVG